ncbi:hypothetical protein P9D43_26325 [Neobacillus niacini]|uniref:hypothetical protein n=1 Tax=Neobacillus niacini TaxID=86668 RepID=UPI0007ABB6E4|nr:hypothetical protein [Neobacillus niacini]MEC1525520.1 hypothetical protein [Neobacillus niacini]
MKKANKKMALFFTTYFLLMVSMILAVTLVDFKPSKSSVEMPETTFKQELEKHEKKIAAKQEEKKKNRWTISRETVMIAVSIGAILDIIIAYIWVRRENRKYDGKEMLNKKRWRNSKIFWNIVAMGVIQPKGKKFVINWFNMIGVSILLHLFFYFFLIKKLRRVWKYSKLFYLSLNKSSTVIFIEYITVFL